MNYKRLKEAYSKYQSSTGEIVPKKSAGYYNFESVQFTPNRSYVWSPVYDDNRKVVTYGDRIQLLRVSNFLENNFAQYGEMINCVSRFAVGRGIDPIPTTSNETFNTLAESTFYNWANNRFCDVEKNKNFYAASRYISERLIAEGEVFVLLVKSKTNNYPQYQFISPLRIRNSGKDNDKSIDGIYYTPEGAPYAYNVFNLEDPGDSANIGDKNYQVISSDNVIHIYNPIGSTGGHGIPWGQSAFNNMRDSKDAMGLTMNAVKNEAFFSMQYQDTQGTGGPVVVNGMAGVPYKPGKPNNTNVVPGTPISSNNSPLNSPSYLEQLTYGTKNKIAMVGSGELKPVLSDRPSTNFQSFMNINMKDICQAVGIPYEFTYDPNNLNNKSGDITIDKTRAFMAEVQEIVIDQFCQRIYGWVISSLLPLQDIRPLGNENPFKVSWNLPERVGANSRNNATNNIDLMNNGLTNKKLYYGSLGLDWKDEEKQWMTEQKYRQDLAKEMGVDLSQAIYGKGTISTTANAPDTSDDDSNFNNKKNNDNEETILPKNK